MAIYHFSRNGVSPAAGSSAVKASAYLSGISMFRELTGVKCSYGRADRVVAHGVALPERAPAAFRDPEALWNAAEAAQCGNECYAHREKMALPKELSAGERKCLMEDYAGKVAKATGHPTEWAIHDQTDGNENYHGHVLESELACGWNGFERPSQRRNIKVYLCRKPGGEDTWVDAADWKRWAKGEGYEKVFTFEDGQQRTMSEAESLGLGKKDRKSKNPVAMVVTDGGEDARDAAKAALIERRKLWADCVNAALERNGIDERVSHLSNAERGIEEAPTRHLGLRAAAVERDAKRRAEEAGGEYHPVTRIGRENEEIRARNAEASAKRMIRANLSELCRLAADRAENIYEYREVLEGWRVSVSGSGHHLLIGDADEPFVAPEPLSDLCPELTPEGLEVRFLENVEVDIERRGAEIAEVRSVVEAERRRVTGIRDAYLEEMRKTYLDYRKKAHGLKGTALVAFPRIELKRPPKEVVDDPEVKRLWLAYRRDADVLRGELASGVPRKVTQTYGGQPQRQEQGQRRAVEQVRTEHNRGKGR